jgi:hypothetical protein
MNHRGGTRLLDNRRSLQAVGSAEKKTIIHKVGPTPVGVREWNLSSVLQSSLRVTVSNFYSRERRA